MVRGSDHGHGNTLWVLGGVALTPWDASVVNPASLQLDHASGVNAGVAVGTGLEYKLGASLGVRGEVMHYGLFGWGLNLPTAGPTCPAASRVDGRPAIQGAPTPRDARRPGRATSPSYARRVGHRVAIRARVLRCRPVLARRHADEGSPGGEHRGSPEARPR